MKRIILAALLSVLCSVAVATRANAYAAVSIGVPGLSVNLGVPGPPVYVAPAPPVYVAPSPPVYYAPPPPPVVYYAPPPPPAYVYGYSSWRSPHWRR